MSDGSNSVTLTDCKFSSNDKSATSTNSGTCRNLAMESGSSSDSSLGASDQFSSTAMMKRILFDIDTELID